MKFLSIIVLTFVASVVGTISGFGLSTIMVPVVLFFFPLPTTLLFVGIIHAFGDVWKVVLFKRGVAKWRTILAFGVPGVIASFLGAGIVLSTPSEILQKVLGGVLVGYVILLAFEPKFKFPQTTLFSGIGGVFSGLLAGISGIGGPVRSMFLSAYSFPKEVYIFASGVIGLFIDTGRLFIYSAGGIKLDSNLGWGLLVFIPISFIGAEVAKKLVDKISQKAFRGVVAAFLFLVGARLLLA